VCVCGDVFATGDRFCSNCGCTRQDAVLLCFCGSPISHGDQFCGNCGRTTQDLLTESTKQWIEEGISAPNCTEQGTDEAENPPKKTGTLCELLARFDPPSCDASDIDTTVDEFSTNSESTLEPDVEITTLMVCEISPRQTVDKFVNLINAHGFNNTYDLIYMPRSKGSHAKCAFINFVRPEFATTFAQYVNDFRFPNSKTGRHSYTRPAFYQGYQSQFDMHANRSKSGTLLTFAEKFDIGQPGYQIRSQVLKL
jgi:hypothetical protein